MIKRIILSALLALFLLFTACTSQENTMRIKVAYMSDSLSRSIEFKQYNILECEGEELVRTVLKYVLTQPQDENMESVFPRNTTIESVTFHDEYVGNNNIAAVELGGSYDTLTGIDKTIGDYCIVLSLCALENVDGVVITSDSLPGGLTSGILRPSDVILTSSSLRITQHTLKLHHPSPENPSKLMVTETTAVATVDTPLTEVVIRELIKLSEQGEVEFINRDTQIISSYIDKDICYLNLSGDFTQLFLRTEDGKNLTVESVVNSLCELEEIDAVSFLIDGRYITDEAGVPRDPIKPS